MVERGLDPVIHLHNWMLIFFRTLEDKYSDNGMEMRPISIGADLSRLHRNSDRPAFYGGYITVPDTFLPLKGTAHRAVKDGDAVKPCQVNHFTSSTLWKHQGLTGDFPSSIPEAEFRVPSQKSHLTANDSRRNLTDSQETAQWIAGPSFTEKLLNGLLGQLGSDQIFWALQILFF